MAKKKSNAAANRQPEDVTQPQKVRTVQDDRAELPNKAGNNDGSMEKLQNLKSLNAVLVKQAHELRVERSSLMSVNGVLEKDNRRLEMKNAEAEDAAVRSDLEKEVMAVVVGDRVGEMLRYGARLVNGKDKVEKRLGLVERELEVLRSQKGSVDRALKELGEYSLDVEKERDELRKEVEVRSREVDVLKEKVAEGLERESEVVKVLQELKKDNEIAAKEKIDNNEAIESLEKENSLLNISLGEALAYGENLKEQIGSLAREKHEVELEKNEKVAIMERLEKEVCGLQESVLGLQAEVQRMREIVAELEKGNAELRQQKEGLSMEFAVLKEKNEGNEEQIRSLLLEKKRLTRDIDESVSEMEKIMNEAQNTSDSLLAEIAELREAHKAELSDMQEMACQIKHKLELAQQSCETQIDEKKKLVMELKSLRIELEAGIAERVRAEKDIQLEKKNVQSLTQNLVELEMKVQESAKEIHQLVNEKSKLIETKEAVEAHVQLLIKEKDLVHMKLKEAEEDVKKARASTESVSIMSDTVLRMLKKTTEELAASSDLLGEEAQLPALQCDEVLPFVSEIEAIKKAFRSREVTLTDMRKQLEMMKQSVAEAQKRKSLWQLASSASAIFAAASASVAYASRGH